MFPESYSFRRMDSISHTSAGDHPDIPENRVTHDQGPTRTDEEFLRKCASKRLLALSEGEIADLTAAMRQLGVDFQCGA